MSPPAKLAGANLVLLTTSLSLAHAWVIFNAGAYIAMLPRIAGGLSIPISYATWTQTDYMISLALGFPVGNWLSRRTGEYRPFLGAMFLFTLASMVCAYCDSLPIYLAARIVLGFVGGISLPIGQSLFIKEFSDSNKSAAVGIWNLFTLIPFTFGPLLGGWLADNWGWRWLFKLNTVVALVVGLIVGVLLKGRQHQKILRRFDTMGFSLAVITLLGFQTWLNQGNDWDWSNSLYLIVILFLTCTALAYFIIWELSLKHPFLDIRLLARRNFLVGASVMFTGFLCFQGLLSMLIVQLQISLGYSSLLAALVFLPMVLFAKPVGSIFHVVSKKCDARLLSSLNLLGFAAVYFWLSHFDQAADYAQLFWPKVFEGLCLGSFFLPLTTLLLHGLPVERQWRAVELAGMLRIAAGAIGITCQGIVLYQRTPLYLTRLGEQYSLRTDSFRPAMDMWALDGISETAGTSHLYQMLRLQARLLSINEAFWLAGWLFVTLAVIVWLAKPTLEPAKLPDSQAVRRENLLLLAEEE